VTEAEIIRHLEDCGALLSGHFLLSSGLHSGQYVQCAQVFQYPRTAEKLCGELAAAWGQEPVDVVIGPAMGAIRLAYELARALEARALFSEREDGVMKLRRFSLTEGERVLVVEDVLTTGRSASEVIENVVRPSGADLVGVACLIDRGGAARFTECRTSRLLKVDIPAHEPAACPLCAEGRPLVKPGSRPATSTQ